MNNTKSSFSNCVFFAVEWPSFQAPVVNDGVQQRPEGEADDIKSLFEELPFSSEVSSAIEPGALLSNVL